MAKTFAQTIGLLLGALFIIGVTLLTQMEPTLVVFLIAFIFLGIAMVYKAIAGKIIQNLELLLTGLASIILGTTGIFGDATLAGISMRLIGFIILIIVSLELFTMFIYHLEGK